MRDYSKGVLVAIGVGATLIIVGLVLTAMAVFGFGAFSRSTANFRGETAAIERTRANAQFRLQAYQGFFDRCAAIQAAEDQARIYRDRLDDAPDNAEARTNLDAVLANRARLIRSYNADATADFTEGQFLDNALPYQIDPTQENTRCAA